MKNISENNDHDMPIWLHLVIGTLVLVIVIIKIIIPVMDIYQSASPLAIDEIRKYADQNQVAQLLFVSTIKKKSILTRSQAKEFRINLMKYVEPKKYKQYIDEIEMKRLAFSFEPIL